MAVVIKEGNVFDSNADIICHQVNCQGVWGQALLKKFASVIQMYMLSISIYVI